jgi:hypothetical protein
MLRRAYAASRNSRAALVRKSTKANALNAGVSLTLASTFQRSQPRPGQILRATTPGFLRGRGLAGERVPAPRPHRLEFGLDRARNDAR